VLVKEIYFDTLEDIPFGLCVCRILRIPGYSGLFKHLHGVQLINVGAGGLLHLKHLSVAALAKHLEQREVERTYFTPGINGTSVDAHLFLFDLIGG